MSLVLSSPRPSPLDQPNDASPLQRWRPSFSIRPERPKAFTSVVEPRTRACTRLNVGLAMRELLMRRTRHENWIAQKSRDCERRPPPGPNPHVHQAMASPPPIMPSASPARAAGIRTRGRRDVRVIRPAHRNAPAQAMLAYSRNRRCRLQRTLRRRLHHRSAPTISSCRRSRPPTSANRSTI